MTNLNLITTTEFAAYAPEVDVSRYTTPTVSGFIAMASQQVTDYLHYSPLAEDITGELKQAMITTEGDLLIYPRKLPIQSVSGITIKKGTQSLELGLLNGASSRYNIDFTRRHIRYPSAEISVDSGDILITNFLSLKGQQFYVELDYRGGFEASELPEVIKLATSLFARDILARSSNTTGARKIQQGGISLEYFEKEGESDLVKDAKILLVPYRRTV